MALITFIRQFFYPVRIGWMQRYKLRKSLR